MFNDKLKLFINGWVASLASLAQADHEHIDTASKAWVAVKEFNLSYHHMDIFIYTVNSMFSELW